MLTLQEAVTLFLGEHIATTRRTYRYTLEPMTNYIGPARPLDKVKPQDLIEFMQSVRARESLKSNASYNKHVKTVRTFFNWCKRTSILTESPALGLRRLRQSKRVDKDKAMPDHLYEQLVDYARWKPRYHALVLFLGDTGCRIGGAAALHWADVDFEQKCAVVTEKGDKTRRVFFGDDCLVALRRWRGAHSMMEGDYVFSQTGRRIKNDNLGQVFSRICANAGIGTWGPHSLRHRKGHQLADNKVAPSVAAQALGHTSVMTTLEYYYPDDWDRVQQAMEQLAHTAHNQPSKIKKISR
ncbi:MAG: site-specific integrase [Anaerolineae bacterium]|nr:site-specific integrase [Anaerolineae bacterium]